MHHGAKNSAFKNTPPVKCATLKTSDSASIHNFLPVSGGLVMSANGPIIDPRQRADLQIAASTNRFAITDSVTKLRSQLRLKGENAMRLYTTARRKTGTVATMTIALSI
jgi:hypothetical protein